MVYAITLVFTLWGLWDLSAWVARYGQETPYSFPFQIMSVPWYIAGDILVAVAILCVAGFIFDTKR
jgi:hypothetical protein